MTQMVIYGWKSVGGWVEKGRIVEGSGRGGGRNLPEVSKLWSPERAG